MRDQQAPDLLRRSGDRERTGSGLSTDSAASEFGSLSLDELEAQICSQAGQLAAATCRWLEMVAVFDERDGAATWGMATTAQWLAWRCGLGPSTAREHVRVARALPDQPVVRAAFRAGRLSYAQVRVISRVVARLPEIETELVEQARGTSAAQLEELCRGITRGDDREDQVTRRARRFLRRSYDEAGWLVLYARIPPEEAALIEAALDAWHAAANSEEPPAPEEPPASAEPEASVELPACAEPGGADPPGGGAADPDLDASGHLAFGGDEPATNGGPTDLVCAHEADEVTAENHLAEDDVHAAPRHQRADADALVGLAEAFLDHGAAGGARADRYQVLVLIDSKTLAQDLPGVSQVAGGGPGLHPETVRRLLCNSSGAPLLHSGGEVLNLGRATRALNTAQRRALQVRDHGRCRFPGCRTRRGVEAHHIIWWSLGGRTDLDNLILLCRRHHMLVHEGGYVIITCRPPGKPIGFVFRRPDGTVLLGPNLPEQVRPLDIDPKITPDTLPPEVSVDHRRIDYPYAVSCFLDAAHQRRAKAS